MANPKTKVNTNDGLEMVEDIRTGYLGSIPENLVILDGHLIFSAEDLLFGEELRKLPLSIATSSYNNLIKSANPKITVFPNPFTDETQISIDPSNTESVILVRIHDILGNLVFSSPMHLEKLLLIGKNLPTGFYMIEVIVSQKSYFLKAIKQ